MQFASPRRCRAPCAGASRSPASPCPGTRACRSDHPPALHSHGRAKQKCACTVGCMGPVSEMLLLLCRGGEVQGTAVDAGRQLDVLLSRLQGRARWDKESVFSLHPSLSPPGHTWRGTCGPSAAAAPWQASTGLPLRRRSPLLCERVEARRGE